MNTIVLLLAQFDARVAIPVDEVCKAFFPHMDAQALVRKINRGEIKLPIMKLESRVKSARTIHVLDLAHFIDAQRAAAHKECEHLSGSAMADYIRGG
jgi:hypothetical protein